jgi:hypothetical protein
MMLSSKLIRIAGQQPSAMLFDPVVRVKIKYHLLYERQPFYYSFGGLCYNVASELESEAVANKRSKSLVNVQCVQPQPLAIGTTLMTCMLAQFLQHTWTGEDDNETREGSPGGMIAWLVITSGVFLIRYFRAYI